MAIFSVPLHQRLDIDTVAKTATVVLYVPAEDGQGDVDVFVKDVTTDLSAADRQRLKYLLDSES